MQKMVRHKKQNLLSHNFLIGGGALLAVALLAGVVYAMPAEWHVASGSTATTTDSKVVTAPTADVTHVKTPDSVKGIYMSECVVGTPSFRDSLVKFIDSTDLNTVVIDIKDFSGTISFRPADGSFKDVAIVSCGARDMQAFIKTLHEKNIYVIGRITVFQDPTYAKAHPEQAVQKAGGGVWKNYGGLAFVDVGATPFWDYIVKLSEESYAVGFDELNYDYIRFPSDGDLKSAVFSYDKGKTKEQALEEFFKYLHGKVSPLGVKMSADLFGYVTIHTDDLGIGQILERALPYFDYIMPMVYPSHYNAGFAGLKNVNSDPYKVVNISMTTAGARAVATTTPNFAFDETKIASTSPQLYTKQVFDKNKLRPWLQSFDYPVPYTPQMVADQITATTDAGLHSWIFWDAGNKYTSLRKVLAK